MAQYYFFHLAVPLLSNVGCLGAVQVGVVVHFLLALVQFALTEVGHGVYPQKDPFA
jgi:hypothetical protein